MESEACQPIDLGFKPYDLTEDNQFSENHIDFDEDDLLGNMSGKKKCHGGSLVGIDDQVPELQSSKEPQRAQRIERYNLRKSLAWDSAFFTNAGVLDQQELSSMIIGANKREQFSLPGIEEDISGSTDSISTLESVKLDLESADEDLFLDIRASIQRSSKKSSYLVTSSSKPKSVEIDSSAMSSLKKEESALEKKIPKPGVKKTGGLQPVRIPKCQPKPNTLKAGSAKAIKQDSSDSQVAQIKSTAKVAETSSSLARPLKAIRRPIPTLPPTAKKDSEATVRVKSEPSVTRKVDQPPKSISSGARRTAASSKSKYVSTTMNRMAPVRSSTSSNSSSNSASSVTSAKPAQILARRYPAKTGHARTGLSSPKPAQSRAAANNKPLHSTFSAQILPTKISSNVSPASSISEWSSASSSSMMFSPRSNNYKTSKETSSRQSSDSGITVLDRQNNSTDEEVDIQRNWEGAALPGKNVVISSAQTSESQAPSKPSGLRRPSPKIGYFDGVKSARTNGPLVIGKPLPSVMPKAGSARCSPAGNSIAKLMSAKVPRARIGTSPASIKLDSSTEKASSSFQEISDAVGNSGCEIMDLNNTSGLFPEAPINPVSDSDSLQEAVNVQFEDVTKDVVGACKTIIVEENKYNSHKETELTVEKKTNDGDVTNAATEGLGSSFLENMNQSEDALANENNNSNDTHLIFEADDKENDFVRCQSEGDALANEKNNSNETHPIFEADDEENDLVRCQGEGLTTHHIEMDPILYGSNSESLRDESSVEHMYVNHATSSDSGFALHNPVHKSNKLDMFPRAQVRTSPVSIKLDSSRDKSSSSFAEISGALGNGDCAIMNLKEKVVDEESMSPEISINPVPESSGEPEIIQVEDAQDIVDACKPTIIKENISNNNNDIEMKMQTSIGWDVNDATVEGRDLVSLGNLDWGENAFLSGNNKQNDTHSVSEADDNVKDLIQHQHEGLMTHNRNLDSVLCVSKFESHESSGENAPVNPTSESEYALSNSNSELTSNKAPSARVSTSPAIIKLDSSEDTSLFSIEEMSEALRECAVTMIDTCGLATGLSINSVPVSLEEAEKDRVEDGANDVVDMQKEPIINENIDKENSETKSNVQLGPEDGDVKNVTADVLSSFFLEDMNLSEDELSNEDIKQNDTRSVSEADDKENSKSIRQLDHVLYLSKSTSVCDAAECPATSSESVSGRTPFAVKNIIGCTDLSTGLVTQSLSAFVFSPEQNETS